MRGDLAGPSAPNEEALASMAVAFHRDAEPLSGPRDVAIGFGPFDPEDALRFELTEQRRSVFLGDLLGAAIVAGAAVWSVAFSLA